MTDDTRFDAARLREFAFKLLKAAELNDDRAEAVSRFLVEADLMGHTTHGLALLPWYLRSFADGTLSTAGEVEVISDCGASLCWRAHRLPGAWVVSEAIRTACDRAGQFGTTTIAVGDSGHIGCLAAYLTAATERGVMISITSSSPSGSAVAPFGGRTGVFTPNPAAHGIPTPGDPILIDISASITTMNMTQRMIAEGCKFNHEWLLDAEGNPTDDPQAMVNGGALLLTGGLDHGQKGYGMALHAEALTQGLSGYGRADGPAKGSTTSFTVQIYDPEAFGGLDQYVRQTGWLVEACKAAKPRPGVEEVRLPGEAALRRKRLAERDGVVLHEGIMAAVVEQARRLGVSVPEGFGGEG